MDLSLSKLKDPPPRPPHGERRRRVRHKLHTPVYASFSGPHSGMVLDLSELLDVHEEGFSVQTSEILEINRPLNICLDLPETNKYIHATGHVVWSDSKGRGGVRLSSLTDESRKQLKEWLFVNALVACMHRSSRNAQLSRSLVDAETSLHTVDSAAVSPVPDLTGLLSAVEAVRREIIALGSNFEAILQLVAERAVSLTGADGAAVAFMTDGELICRARAGSPAPSLGARVDASVGLTGECVTESRIVHCEDAETDSRVDHEVCRELGVASILAAPIVSDYRVHGLIEVFSSRPKAFGTIQESAIEHLTAIVPTAVQTAPRSKLSPKPEVPAEKAEKPAAQRAMKEPETDGEEPLSGVGVRPLHLLLLILAVGFTALSLGYVLAPTIEKRWLAKNEPAPSVVAASEKRSAPKAAGPVKENSVLQLRAMADAGDAGAQYELGARYHSGDGVPQSDAEAVKWFLKAAEQGHVVSQAMLGYFYWIGQGVPRDIPKAYFWSVLARAGGDEASKYRVESMASSMTRAQTAAIQQEAEVWLHEHSANPQQSKK